jgi:hypothetical protein
MTMAPNPIAALLIAAALAGTPALATDSRPHAPRQAAHPAAVHPRPPSSGLDGVLVAPGCGTNCMNKAAETPSVIDWVKAQLQRLVS